jgi:hypothetical protein
VLLLILKGQKTKFRVQNLLTTAEVIFLTEFHFEEDKAFLGEELWGL